MIEPNCHHCIFDWSHQSGPTEQHDNWHCVIYKPNPGKEHCRQMLQVPMKIISLEPEAVDAKVAANRQRYESEPELKALADKIHHHRMMTGEACDQCICLAISRLDSKKARAK